MDLIKSHSELSYYLLPAGDLFSIESKFWRVNKVETGEEVVRLICDERKSAQQKGTICKTVEIGRAHV